MFFMVVVFPGAAKYYANGTKIELITLSKERVERLPSLHE
jgi:hypothetical protein